MDSMSNLGSLLEAKPGVVWDSISAAYLERTVLEEFLRKIFGILKPRVEVDFTTYFLLLRCRRLHVSGIRWTMTITTLLFHVS